MFLVQQKAHREFVDGHTCVWEAENSFIWCDDVVCHWPLSLYSTSFFAEENYTCTTHGVRSVSSVGCVHSFAPNRLLWARVFNVTDTRQIHKDLPSELNFQRTNRNHEEIGTKWAVEIFEIRFVVFFSFSVEPYTEMKRAECRKNGHEVNFNDDFHRFTNQHNNSILFCFIFSFHLCRNHFSSSSWRWLCFLCRMSRRWIFAVAAILAEHSLLRADAKRKKALKIILQFAFIFFYSIVFIVRHSHAVVDLELLVIVIPK